jgi:hypothetical protein
LEFKTPHETVGGTPNVPVFPNAAELAADDKVRQRDKEWVRANQRPKLPTSAFGLVKFE